jgi:hypothetical protein
LDSVDAECEALGLSGVWFCLPLVIVPSGRCEKFDLETWSNFGLEKIAPGCFISGRQTFGIHFGSDEILEKSFFSHLPVTGFCH